MYMKQYPLVSAISRPLITKHLVKAAQEHGGTHVSHGCTGKRARTKTIRDKAQETTDSERIRQLEKEVSKLREERDILRKAAKYFAEETRGTSA